MNVYEQTRGETLILQPSGRLDSTTSQDFQQNILGRIQTGAIDIVLDLSDLDYISSAGLRVLLMSAKAIKEQDGNLAICAMKDNVREVFEISGFISLFPIHGSVDEAFEATS